MEFNIKKKSTLPYIEVDVIKSGRSDFRYNGTDLTDATIYFYMKDVENGVYKIARANATFSIESNTVVYQFSKKNTSSIGRYEGEFKIETSQGIVDLPLKEKLYINILDSFSNTDYCCGPNQNINPTPIPPTPDKPGIYYGKINKTSIINSDVSSLTFEYKNEGNDFYVSINPGEGYSYILVPNSISQPAQFRDSLSGCNGFVIPTNNIGTINLVDLNGFLVTYNIYRSFYSFNGNVNIWLCS